MFLKELHIKYFSKNSLSDFFIFLKIFSKICQIFNFFSTILFKLKTFLRITIKWTLHWWTWTIQRGTTNHRSRIWGYDFIILSLKSDHTSHYFYWNCSIITFIGIVRILLILFLVLTNKCIVLFTRREIWKTMDKLNKNVNIMLVGEKGNPLHQLELIVLLRRLGVSYHFENVMEKGKVVLTY